MSIFRCLALNVRWHIAFWKKCKVRFSFQDRFVQIFFLSMLFQRHYFGIQNNVGQFISRVCWDIKPLFQFKQRSIPCVMSTSAVIFDLLVFYLGIKLTKMFIQNFITHFVQVTFNFPLSCPIFKEKNRYNSRKSVYNSPKKIESVMLYLLILNIVY